MKKGFFITFEGADGCGKTTQLNLTAEFLKEKNIQFITTREPGAGKLGAKLREILLHFDGVIADKCESLLYAADRAQHVQTEIIPAINEGKIVLCDRYTDSTLAYQGYGRGINLEEIEQMNQLATEGFKPDLTIVFDVDSEIAQQRVGAEKDRLEQEGLEFHKKLRNGYLEISKKEPKRVKVINANQSIEQVFEDTKAVISELLGL